MSEPTIHYANPDETTFTGAYFMFSFGAYGDTKVCVIQRPDHLDDALETAAEWLAENGHKGLFSEPDYERCPLCVESEAGPCESCCDEAETDHTYTESGWLLSWEWTVKEEQGDPFATPTFDRFDIIEAWFCYWNAWHGGQFTDGYRNLCRAMRLGGQLRDDVDRFDTLSENGQAIYRKLALQDGR